MSDGAWLTWAREAGEAIAAAGQWRQPRAFDAAGPEGHLVAADVDVVSFASNDYLGLTQHPEPAAAAAAALARWGTGAGAARLIVGSRPVHHELEVALAEWRDEPAAVLYPTGYAANLGALTTLAGRGVLVCSDERNHASIIDGCRLARAGGAELAVYPHGDVAAVDRALAGAPGRALVVSDLVFSMDGDVAPVDDLLEVCARHDALLVLDEAHAVLGPTVAPGPEGPTVVRVGTLSKTVGVVGGFVAGPQVVVDVLVNRSRPYIFTTALPPADAAAALAAVAVVRGADGEQRRRRLRRHVDRLVPGWPSPILPLVVGDEQTALDAADALLARGLLVPAIRPPTVAPGTSRLRIALSAAHTDDHLDRLVGALDELDLRHHLGGPT